ncbi:hypothetical protein EVG20_g9429, partial [Dentipellis fragilis]
RIVVIPSSSLPPSEADALGSPDLDVAPVPAAAPEPDAAATEDLDLAYPSPGSASSTAAEDIDHEMEDDTTPMLSGGVGSSPVGKKRAREEAAEEEAKEDSEKPTKRRKVKDGSAGSDAPRRSLRSRKSLRGRH